MKTILVLLILAMMVACSSTPTIAPTVAVPATVAPPATNTPRPTDLPTSTPAPSWTPTATVTPAPTDTSAQTATATSAATWTPSATAMATTASVDVSAWRLPLLAAALTVDVIERMEMTAADLQAGTLASVEAGIYLLGYQAALGTVATELDKAPPAGRAARYGDVLRANLAGVYGVLTRWQQGEVTSATAAAELASVRAASEQALAEIVAELRGLGVSDEQMDVLMMEISGVFDEK